MYVTNLDKKICEMGNIKKVPTVCVWSDLLGFSNVFKESNWSPSDEEWIKIASRLRDMQIICARTLSLTHEECLVSNDAIIRNYDIEAEKDMFMLSFWVRNIVYYFLSVNANENKKNLYGMRLVISGGERLIHNHEKITFEDYVYNYTKKDADKPSSYTQRYGERELMHNHSFMQMNTAFSKSYIIDTVGSKGGIKGNHFFVEESFIGVLKEKAKECGMTGELIIDVESDGVRKFFINKKESKGCYLGFRLSEPQEISKNGLKTKVYKLDRFYPCDEDSDEFYFNLNNFDMYVSIDAANID